MARKHTKRRGAVYCQACGAPIGQPSGRGRRRVTCSDSCRMKLHRIRIAKRKAARV